MSYGLQTKDAEGNILVDIDEKINRVRYAYEAAIDESDSITLSDINGLLTVQMAFTINATLVTQGAHEVTRSGTIISWIPNSIETYIHSPSLIIVFIYV